MSEKSEYLLGLSRQRRNWKQKMNLAGLCMDVTKIDVKQFANKILN